MTWQKHGARSVATSSSEWRRLRVEVLRRDDGVCHMCHGRGADAVDHLVPVSRGGTDDPTNLAAVHDSIPPHCHRSKTAAEGHAAARAMRAKGKHPIEQHPGFARGGVAK